MRRVAEQPHALLRAALQDQGWREGDAVTVISDGDPATGAGAKRLITRCTEQSAYIESNEGVLIDYGQRYRAGKPISTSRAEGTSTSW